MVNETSEAHFLASVAHAFSLTVLTPWHNNPFLFTPLALVSFHVCYSCGSQLCFSQLFLFVPVY